MKKKFFTSVFIIFSLNCFAAGVERYGLYIGANNGGNSKSILSYAESDATSFKNTMSELGGIPNENSILLLSPKKNEIDDAFAKLSNSILKNKSKNRTEVIIYYSGHSDEDGLFLNNSCYSYSDLKKQINSIPCDIHVVILDSCYSGSFIRTKGGIKQKPFLLDDSSKVSGHAYLSSSSEWESSQESDEIEGSFFTNSLLSGLRGAADSNNDKKVTLNELYSYAFLETLHKTEETKSGPQHPNYNITLTGSGDLVLTDYSNSNCLLEISEDVLGKIIIRNENGKIISELDKNETIPILLALPDGKYKITQILNNVTSIANYEIKKNETVILKTSDLESVTQKENLQKGDESTDNSSVVIEDTYKLAFDNLFFRGDGFKEKKYVSYFGELDTKFYLPTNIPFDINGRNVMKLQDKSTLNNYYDLTLGIESAFFDKNFFSFAAGSEFGVRFSPFSSSEKYAMPLINPFLSFYWQGPKLESLDKNNCEGLGIKVFPVFDYSLNPEIKSYWNNKTAIDICLSLNFNGFGFTDYFRNIFCYNKNEFAYDFQFGASLCFTLTGKKTKQRIDNYNKNCKLYKDQIH